MTNIKNTMETITETKNDNTDNNSLLSYVINYFNSSKTENVKNVNVNVNANENVKVKNVNLNETFTSFHQKGNRFLYFCYKIKDNNGVNKYHLAVFDNKNGIDNFNDELQVITVFTRFDSNYDNLGISHNIIPIKSLSKYYDLYLFNGYLDEYQYQKIIKFKVDFRKLNNVNVYFEDVDYIKRYLMYSKNFNNKNNVNITSLNYFMKFNKDKEDYTNIRNKYQKLLYQNKLLIQQQKNKDDDNLNQKITSKQDSMISKKNNRCRKNNRHKKPVIRFDDLYDKYYC